MKLLTTKQVAEILQVNVEIVYRYIRAGKLKAFKLGSNGNNLHKRWRIKEEDLHSFIGGSCEISKTIPIQE